MGYNQWQLKSILEDDNRVIKYENFSKIDLIEMIIAIRNMYIDEKKDNMKLLNEIEELKKKNEKIN